LTLGVREHESKLWARGESKDDATGIGWIAAT
jgi:hypothetical protein